MNIPFNFKPITVSTGPRQSLESQVESVHGMPLTPMTAAFVDELIEREKTEPNESARMVLLGYRQQFCTHGMHSFGEWRQGGGGGYFDQDRIYTGRIKRCSYCMEARHEITHDGKPGAEP